MTFTKNFGVPIYVEEYSKLQHHSIEIFYQLEKKISSISRPQEDIKNRSKVVKRRSVMWLTILSKNFLWVKVVWENHLIEIFLLSKNIYFHFTQRQNKWSKPTFSKLNIGSLYPIGPYIWTPVQQLPVIEFQ